MHKNTKRKKKLLSVGHAITLRPIYIRVFWGGVALTLLCSGCKTVKRARAAQNAETLMAGEFTVSAAGAGLDASRPFTLDDLEQIACNYHPSLVQAYQTVESARLQCVEIRAGQLPQLTASAGYNRYTQNRWGFSTSSEAQGNWSGALGLDLLLYDFGKTAAAKRQALENWFANLEQLRDLEIEVIYNVRLAFYEQHRSSQLLQVRLESVEQFKQHLEEARTMVEVGVRRPYDLTKAEVDLGNARLEAITASNNLVLAHARLNRALGLAENPSYQLLGASLPTPAQNADHLLENARDNAPAVAIQRARVRMASAYVDQTIADLYPSLNLSVDGDLSGRDFPLVWNFSWAVRLVQNIFDGHRKTARIDDAVTQLRIARAQLAETEQQIYLQLVDGETNLQSAQTRAEVARMILKQAEDNLAIVNEQYRVGLSSPIERTDAQVALTEAQANIIRAEYDAQIAISQILRLIGATPEHLVKNAKTKEEEV